jgi:hypothetical protein
LQLEKLESLHQDAKIPLQSTFLDKSEKTDGNIINGQYSYIDPLGSLVVVKYSVNQVSISLTFYAQFLHTQILKVQKDTDHFTLLGSACSKALSKHIGEIDTRMAATMLRRDC